MKAPLVSVGIPAYNHGKYIAETINSVLNQTFTDFELIISDDGSTDDTADVIRSYKDGRIKTYFFEKNVGQKMNIDKICNLANGKYLAMVPSDDYWDVTKIEKQVMLMEGQKDLGACFTYANLVDEYGAVFDEKHHFYDWYNQPRTQKELIQTFFHRGNCLVAPSCFGLLDVFKPLFLAGHHLRQVGDYDVWIKLVKKVQINILPERLAYHRRRNDMQAMSSFSPANAARTINELAIVMRDFFTDMPEELFYEAFSDKLIKKGELSKHELMCEQAFLILNHYANVKIGRMLAVEKFHLISQNPECFSILVNDYGFTQKDFWQLMTTYKLREFPRKISVREIAKSSLAPFPTLYNYVYSKFG